MQKSISVWALKSQKSGSQYKDPSSYSTPPRRRLSRYWHETVNAEEVVSLDKRQLDRQEACPAFMMFVKWLKHGIAYSVTLYVCRFDVAINCVIS